MPPREIPVGTAIEGPNAGAPVFATGLANLSFMVSGPSGSGKTVWLAGRILAEIRRGTNVIAVDPKGELGGYLRRWAPAALSDVARGDVLVVRPSEGQVVPLNPLRLPLPAKQIAGIVRRNLESALGDEFGVRQAAACTELLAALADAGGAITQVEEVIRSERARAALIPRIKSPRLKEYVIDGLSAEPELTLAALAARVAHLLEAREVSAMLGAARTVAGAELVGRRLVIVDLGNAPMGQRRAYDVLLRIVFSTIAHSLLARKNRTPRALVVIDEAQAVVGDLAETVAQMLQELRWRGASVILASQGVQQLTNKLLRESIMANVGGWLALCPRAAELKLLAEHLPRPTFRRVDADRPDVLMSERQEAALIERHLLSLRPRQGVWIPFGAPSVVLQTPNVPIAALELESARQPEERREVFAIGSSSTVDELEAECVPPLVAAPTGTPSGRRAKKMDLPPC